MIESNMTLSESDQPGRCQTRKLSTFMACIKCYTGNAIFDP